MSKVLKPGTRLFSAVCKTQMIAVKAPPDEVDITIGGVEPVLSADEAATGGVVPGFDGGTAMGKRYVDDADTIELLCTAAGEGVPALGGVVLNVKSAKPLPASD